MSAFLVNKQHIDALVAVAIWGPRREGGPGRWSGPTWYSEPVDPWAMDWDEIGKRQRTATLENADALGQMLYDANAHSIRARYGDDATEIYQDEVVHYRFSRPGVMPTAVQVLKMCHCLDYQSCEYAGWRSSTARRFLDALEDCVARALPGYDDAPWECPPS